MGATLHIKQSRETIAHAHEMLRRMDHLGGGTKSRRGCRRSVGCGVDYLADRPLGGTMRPCVTWHALRSWTIAPVLFPESDTAVMCPTTRAGLDYFPRRRESQAGWVRRATQRPTQQQGGKSKTSGASVAYLSQFGFPPSAPSAFNILQYLKLFDFFPS